MRWEVEIVRRNDLEVEIEIIDLETMQTVDLDKAPDEVKKEAMKKLEEYKRELRALKRIINVLPDKEVDEITIEAKPVGGVAEPWTLSGDTDNAKEILESMGYKEIKLNPWNFDTVWRFGRLEEDDPLLPEKAEALKRIISRCFVKVNVMVRGRKVRELYVMRKGGRLK
jgi:hypothetical protein